MTRVEFKPYDIIVRPVLTEKTSLLQEKGNCYTFVVSLKATKSDVKKAVESAFSVQVKAVNTLTRKGKKKAFKGYQSLRGDQKRAYVSLMPGQSIEQLSVLNLGQETVQPEGEG
jgi:large subunit ribosomal protein L23